jgi:hypothetical protein
MMKITVCERPNEPGFWEASWYERGGEDFSIAPTS